MKNIEKDIVNYLLSKKDEYVSSSDIGFALGVSSRTIRNYMSNLKNTLTSYGASLDVYHGQGFKIVIEDQAKFKEYLQDDEQETPFSSPEARKKYILLRLLTATDYINSYELADEVSVSASLLRIHLKEIAEILERYHLTLVNSKLNGYKVEGDEKNVRLCIVQECRNTTILDSYFKHEDHLDYVDGLQDILEDAMHKFNIAISSESIKSLKLHFLIAIARLKAGNEIDIDKNVVSQIHVTPEFFAMGYITKQIKEKYGIAFTENEQVYMTMHITGIRRLYGHEHLQVEVTREAIVFINKFLRNIYKSTGVDLFEDEELRISLLNHIVPFLTRVRTKFIIQQNDLTGIKNSYPYAYELAVYGLDGLLTQDQISSAEIAYFTLHIALALEKRESIISEKLNALVLCKDVESMYMLLSYRLKKELDDYFNSFYFMAIEDFEKNKSEENYDVILNTTEENITSHIPVIRLSSRVTDQDVQNVRSVTEKMNITSVLFENFDQDLFIHLTSVENKEQVLQTMIQTINKKYQLPDNFYDLVLQRENIDSTEFGKYIAIPHSISPIKDCSFVCIAKLDKPIRWVKEDVQFVFLINLPESKKTKWFLDTITSILSSEGAIKELTTINNFEEFIQVLEK